MQYNSINQEIKECIQILCLVNQKSFDENKVIFTKLYSNFLNIHKKLIHEAVEQDISSIRLFKESLLQEFNNNSKFWNAIRAHRYNTGKTKETKITGNRSLYQRAAQRYGPVITGKGGIRSFWNGSVINKNPYGGQNILSRAKTASGNAVKSAAAAAKQRWDNWKASRTPPSPLPAPPSPPQPLTPKQATQMANKAAKQMGFNSIQTQQNTNNSKVNRRELLLSNMSNFIKQCVGTTAGNTHKTVSDLIKTLQKYNPNTNAQATKVSVFDPRTKLSKQVGEFYRTRQGLVGMLSSVIMYNTNKQNAHTLPSEIRQLKTQIATDKAQGKPTANLEKVLKSKESYLQRIPKLLQQGLDNSDIFMKMLGYDPSNVQDKKLFLDDLFNKNKQFVAALKTKNQRQNAIE